MFFPNLFAGLNYTRQKGVYDQNTKSNKYLQIKIKIKIKIEIEKKKKNK